MTTIIRGYLLFDCGWLLLFLLLYLIEFFNNAGIAAILLRQQRNHGRLRLLNIFRCCALECGNLGETYSCRLGYADADRLEVSPMHCHLFRRIRSTFVDLKAAVYHWSPIDYLFTVRLHEWGFWWQVLALYTCHNRRARRKWILCEDHALSLLVELRQI